MILAFYRCEPSKVKRISFTGVNNRQCFAYTPLSSKCRSMFQGQRFVILKAFQFQLLYGKSRTDHIYKGITSQTNRTIKTRSRDYEGQVSLSGDSGPSSQLHLQPQVPEHTDGIKRIDSTCTGNLTRVATAMIPEVDKCNSRLPVPLLLHPHPPFARLGHRHRLCTGSIPFPSLFDLGNSLSLLLKASENYIGEDDGNDIATGPASLPRSARSCSDTAIAWRPVPASRATTATHFGSRYHLHRRS